MPQVEYIANGTKTDSIRGVGLTWEPGQVRNVTVEVAERLLVHPDTWVKELEAAVQKDVDTTSTPITEEIGLSVPEKPAEEPLPVIDFHGMDKTAMINFAETNYNERFDKRQNEEAIRHKLISLVAKHELAKEEEAK